MPLLIRERARDPRGCGGVFDEREAEGQPLAARVAISPDAARLTPEP